MKHKTKKIRIYNFYFKLDLNFIIFELLKLKNSKEFIFKKYFDLERRNLKLQKKNKIFDLNCKKLKYLKY